jgi:hypothetical protein
MSMIFATSLDSQSDEELQKTSEKTLNTANTRKIGYSNDFTLLFSYFFTAMWATLRRQEHINQQQIVLETHRILLILLIFDIM